MPSAKSFNRGKPKFKPQPTVLVICEDKESGKNYLQDASNYFKAQALVRLVHCGNTDPKGIVEEALRQAKHYEQVFCAIDRDTHENFDEAVLLAATSTRVKIILSFPCIEFWYLLHFGYTRRAFGRTGNRSPGDNAVAALRKCEGFAEYAKGDNGSVFATLFPLMGPARITSARVLAQAVAENELNPSTQIHLLLNHFELLGSPQLL